MYEDYGNVRFFYDQHLRDSEQRQKRNELLRAARGNEGHELNDPREGFVQQIVQLFNARNQPKQGASDVQHAPAL